MRSIWSGSRQGAHHALPRRPGERHLHPAHSGPDFHGDRFTFAIDEVDPTGKTTEKIAGANNICAANAAFDEYLRHQNERTILQLRHGGRIIREENAIGDSREWLIAKGDRNK